MNADKAWVKGLIGQLVGWIVRPRNIGFALLVGCTPLLAALVSSGFSLELSNVTEHGAQLLKFSSKEGPPALILGVVTWVVLVGWIAGLVLLVTQEMRVRKKEDASRVIVVELRGLVDTSDQTLIQAVPAKIKGHKIDAYIDIRKYMAGVPPNIHSSLEEITHLPRQVRQHRGDSARENVSVVVGGVLPVPFLFYAGMLLDDEGKVFLFDWERTRKEWKQLTEPDDGVRFSVSGLAEAGRVNTNAVLAVSASYKVDMVGIASAFPGMPVVTLALPESQLNGLWSEDKQAALANQFLQTLGKLGDQGVTCIHLVLAVPSSLALRLGQTYDPRNMPDALCYQYERMLNPVYPWSVRMPTPNAPAAYVITPSNGASAN